MISVALIPPRGLHAYALQSHMHMALATTACFKNPDYVELYQSVTDFIILDNGANEDGQSAPADRIDFYAETIGASEIVLPDVMGNRDRTINAIDRFLISHRGIAEKYRCMAVLHAPTQRQTLNTVAYYEDNPYIKTLGIPRMYVDQVGQLGARISLAGEIQKFYGDRFAIHFLGAVPEWPAEVRSAAKYVPFIRSLDSSLPFNFTIAGLKLADNSRKVVRRPATYFTRDFGGLNRDLLKANIDTFKEWANGNK